MSRTPNQTTIQARRNMELLYKTARSHWPGFQTREGQKAMMVTALAAFLAHTEERAPAGAKIAIIEGQTGSGKTVGYLIPALAAALATGKQVVVTTATVALQEQLVGTDLPRLAHVASEAGLDMRYAMAKGRGRYVCKMSLINEIAQQDQDEQMEGYAAAPQGGCAATVQMYRSMSDALERKAWNGERDTWSDDLDASAWRPIQADRTTCTGSKCRHFSTCGYQLSRQGAQSATIVVANHALVLSTLATETGQIDPKKTLFVFDEGHHLPEIGVEHAMRRYPMLAAGQQLRRLGQILTDAQRKLSDEGLRGQCTQAREALRTLGGQLGKLYEALSACEQLHPKDGAAVRWRFPHGQLPPALAASIARTGEVAREVLQATDALTRWVKELAATQPQAAAELPDLGQALGRLQDLADVCKAWAHVGKVPRVKWVERAAGSKDLVLCTSALTAASDLNRMLWEPAAAAVVTSATITACGSFDFYERMTGLAKWPGRQTLRTLSPFNYETQGEILIPKMRASPKQVAEFSRELCTRLPEMLRNGRNGQMALFSSRRQMEAVYQALDPDLKGLVLMQGMLPRNELLRRHKQAIEAGGTSIIFGLQSLGEGIDLPGPLLEHLYIDKVPFAPPDSVGEEALAEWLEQQQRDAFSEITLPKAAQRLAQWAGRGIRTPTDWARITIFDTRLQTAKYGAKIMEGLPPLPVVGT